MTAVSRETTVYESDAAVGRESIGRILMETLRSSQSPHEHNVYDELLREVSGRAAREQSIGKADIGALVVWKRSNASSPWARNLMNTPDAIVREITAEAYLLVNDEEMPIPAAGGAARQKLWHIAGLGGTGAIASAVLLAMSSSRMAVWDSRVSKSLEAMSRRPKGRHHYSKYLETVLNLAESMQEFAEDDHVVIPRDVDLALFHSAENEDVLNQLRRASAAG